MGEICCSPGGPRMTKVRIGDAEVGLAALSDVFKKFHEAGKKPGDVDGRELVREVSIYNYIPSEAWDDYAGALIKEYERYCNEEII